MKRAAGGFFCSIYPCSLFSFASQNPKNTSQNPVKPEKIKPLSTARAKNPTEPKDRQASKSDQPTMGFIKGELTNFVGSTKLVTKNNRIGVMLGYRQVDLKHYATINPEADLRLKNIDFGLGVPLAFELFDGAWNEETDKLTGFHNAGAFRSQDWDEPGEYVRFIRYITYGQKEDRLFVNISQHASNSVGHGAVMRRYSANIDPDSTRVTGEVDAYNDYAGFEFVTDNIVAWNILGGIGFVKPLSFFSTDPIARSVSIGVTYMIDRKAPVRVKTDTQGVPNPYWIMGSSRPETQSHATVQAWGVDLEAKILKTEQVDLKPYIDYSWLLPGSPSEQEPITPHGGGGLTLGMLGRFNFGSDPIHAMRTIVELRSHSADYLPGYFDTFYEIHKYTASLRYTKYASQTNMLPPTKFVDVFIHRKGHDRQMGFYLEFNYALLQHFALTLSLEGSSAERGNHFLSHVEVPLLSWLQFFFSFHQHAMEDLGDLFSTDGRDKIALGALRLKMLPFLFFNFRYHHTFRLREDVADLNGDGFENSFRFYLNTQGWLANFELGWEF